LKIYAIADLHLSFDERIDKPMSVFGEGWDNYEERLKAAWTGMITEEDLVLLPGDLSWGLKVEEAIADLEWIHALPGRKVMVKGNHDLWWNKIGYLNSLYDDMYFLQNDAYPADDNGLMICGSRGWELPGSEDYDEHDQKIYDRELMRLEFSLKDAMQKGAKRIIASLHYPPADDRSRTSRVTELLEQYPVTDCVYGHLHGMQAFGKGIKGMHNGIEYSLISLDYLGAVPKLVYDGK
jgi:predicted phosphohydrolase